MTNTNVSTNATRRDTLALTGAGIVAAIGGTIASKARADTPEITPELARLIAVEAAARAAYDEFSPIYNEADRNWLARDITAEAMAEAEREELARSDVMWDAQCDVIAFPAIKPADTIAKAKWIAERYTNPAEFMSNEAEAIWSAFVTIANLSA